MKKMSKSPPPASDTEKVVLEIKHLIHLLESAEKYLKKLKQFEKSGETKGRKTALLSLSRAIGYFRRAFRPLIANHQMESFLGTLSRPLKQVILEEMLNGDGERLEGE